MRHQHDGIHLALNLLDGLLHRLYRVGKVKPFDAVGAFSELSGHRRIHTDNADLHPLTFNDFIRGQIRFAAVPQNIPGKRRAFKLVQRGRQRRQAKVELMVAHHPDVIVQGVKPEDHRAGFVVFEGFDKVALNGVARVDQDDVRLLAAHFAHLSRNLAQAARQIFGIRRVIPGDEGAMEIGSAQNRDIDRFSHRRRGT